MQATVQLLGGDSAVAEAAVLVGPCRFEGLPLGQAIGACVDPEFGTEEVGRDSAECRNAGICHPASFGVGVTVHRVEPSRPRDGSIGALRAAPQAESWSLSRKWPKVMVAHRKLIALGGSAAGAMIAAGK